MKSITLRNLSKSVGGETILDKINLSIPSGGFFALLGPSGCGKTTLLRLIAGLEKADSGEIFLGKKSITNTPVHKRSINVVFQSYALFPHMTVFENIAYSLRLKNVKYAELEKRVFEIADVMQIKRHLFKHPRQLSGGQQQRVALARALVSKPDVVLLDEPLAALDFKLREKMLIDLINIQDEQKTTFIYVTHDQFEALTVADRLAIMNKSGEIEQEGSPKEIYEFPITSYVARFVGTTNLLEGKLKNIASAPEIDIPNLGSFKLSIQNKKPWIRERKNAIISLRPEKVFISKSSAPNFDNKLHGVVENIVYHGRSTQYNVRLKNGMIMQVFEQNEAHFPTETIDYDDHVYLFWQKENTVILEK